MPATTRLVVNADDLGLARSVNRGIVQTMAGGVVRSASLIVNTAAADDAVCCLREAREAGLDIGIGLHFNIVTGRPLTSCPSLAPGGAFHSLPVLALRALAGAVVAAEVEAELRAQLARARRRLATLGLTVTHVDSHRHAHALPGIYDVVVRTARDEDVPHVRHPVESPRVSLGRPAVWLAGALLRAAAATRREALDDVGFAGLALMRSRALDRDMARLLARLPGGTVELMVHPGYDSAELAAIDPYRAPRERELRLLTSPALRRRLAELGMEPTHFGATAPTASPATRPVPAVS